MYPCEAMSTQVLNTCPDAHDTQQLNTCPDAHDTQQLNTCPDSHDTQHLNTCPDSHDTQQLNTCPDAHDTQQLNTCPDSHDTQHLNTCPDSHDTQHLNTCPDSHDTQHTMEDQEAADALIDLSLGHKAVAHDELETETDMEYAQEGVVYEDHEDIVNVKMEPDSFGIRLIRAGILKNHLDPYMSSNPPTTDDKLDLCWSGADDGHFSPDSLVEEPIETVLSSYEVDTDSSLMDSDSDALHLQMADEFNCLHSHSPGNDVIELEEADVMVKKLRNREHAKKSRARREAARTALREECEQLESMMLRLIMKISDYSTYIKIFENWLGVHRVCRLKGVPCVQTSKRIGDDKTPLPLTNAIASKKSSLTSSRVDSHMFKIPTSPVKAKHKKQITSKVLAAMENVKSRSMSLSPWDVESKDGCQQESEHSSSIKPFGKGAGPALSKTLLSTKNRSVRKADKRVISVLGFSRPNFGDLIRSL